MTRLPALPELAVTGSTGVLGGMVARQLADAGTAQRLLARDASRAPELEGGVPLVFSYADPALAKQALEGVKVLFMVSGQEAEDRLQQDPALHVGATYNLTGPEELTLTRVAEILTKGTGRTISYQPETVEEAYRSRESYGAPPWLVDAWVSTYTAIAAGEQAGLSPDVHTLTGREPVSLAGFVHQPQL